MTIVCMHVTPPWRQIWSIEIFIILHVMIYTSFYDTYKQTFTRVCMKPIGYISYSGSLRDWIEFIRIGLYKLVKPVESNKYAIWYLANIMDWTFIHYNINLIGVQRKQC